MIGRILRSYLLSPLYRHLIRYPQSEKYYSRLLPINYTSNLFTEELKSARLSYEQWEQLEQQYKNLMSLYVHPYWQKVRKEMQKFLMTKLGEDYLRSNLILHNLGGGRGGITKDKQEKLSYILSKNDKVRQFMQTYTDSRVGKPILYRNISFNKSMIVPSSLDYIYYLARIVRDFNSHIETYVCFGGGYGGFSRIVRLYNPKATVLIIDLPEMLALQQLYHAINFPTLPLVSHFKPSQHILEGGLNLLPVWWLRKINWKPEIFISTFALTETTDYLIKEVIKTNLLSAKHIFILGGKNSFFNTHNTLLPLVRKTRENCQIKQITSNLAYEVLA
jgi:putative sugar O-methyltransferase